MGLDHPGIWTAAKEQVAIGNVPRILEQPAFLRLIAAHQLQGASKMLVGRQLALALPPGVIGGGRPAAGPEIGYKALPQHKTAFIDLFGHLEVRRARFRSSVIALLQLFDRSLKQRVTLPRFPRRARHGRVDEPGLQALEPRIGGQQLVQRSRARARYARNHYRSGDGVPVKAGVFRHGFNSVGPPEEPAEQPAPGDAPSPLAEMR